MVQERILKPGRNCWRISRAERVSFLVDGASYFKALHDNFPLAQHQILILAWDIYSQLKLVPGQDGRDDPTAYTISRLLDGLVRRKSGLRVNILSWDFSLVLSLSREWLPIFKLEWSTHRRLKFCLDDQYPIGASHHQKVVVIDDALAFAGGLDITRGRWDTPAHDKDDARRQDVDGHPVPIRPHHDVQIAVSGAAAAALGELARERWRRGTGATLDPPEKNTRGVWSAELPVDVEEVDVAIARTQPAYEGTAEVREVEQLYVDSIAAAREYIYLENQYFTSPAISRALARRLSESDGPEVVLNLARNTEGWLSQQSMDMMRVSMIHMLRAADKYKRLGVYYPDKSDLGAWSINVHSKVMIMDDRFVRIGSANLNNRSMGLDTECDLAIEADPDDQRVRDAIRHFRNRLLGEHLDCKPEEVDARVRQQGSLLRGIEDLRGKPRTLNPLEPQLGVPDERTLSDIQFTDPERPMDPEMLLKHFVPEKQARPAGWRIASWLIMLLVLVGIALAWRFTPLKEWLDIAMLSELANEWRGSSFTPVIVIAAFVISGLLVVPVTAMIVVSSLVFGPLLGFAYALTGSLLSALAGYGAGILLGRNAIRQLAGKHINQVSRQLAKRGLFTMLVVRIIPVAPFTIVNLVAGASNIRFRDFLLGTLFGMTPGIFAITILVDRVGATLRTPDWQTVLAVVLVAFAIFTAGYFLSKRLLMLAGKKAAETTQEEAQRTPDR